MKTELAEGVLSAKERDCMKKKGIIGICMLLAILCLIPVRLYLEDGGTVLYKAILYEVEDVHRIGAEDAAEDEYLEGTIVKILGLEIYNDVV